MKKPPSVRVAGWAFVVLGSLGTYLAARHWSGNVPMGSVLGIFAYLICMLGVAMVWMAGTAAWRARARAALKNVEEKADNMTFRRLAALAGPRLHIDQSAAHAPLEAEDCAQCKRPLALLWCARCKLWFCWDHCLQHVKVCEGEIHPINRAKRILAGVK